MSNKALERALDAGLKRYPERITGHTKSLLSPSELVDANIGKRIVFMEGYKQGEKDTIERAIEWLKVHAKDYIVNMTGSYPDAPFYAIIGGECWDELKKVMEEDNG